MATVTKPPGTNGVGGAPKDKRDDKQLRHDRIVGIAAIVIILLVTALLIWLASLGGSGAVHDIDYWPMMP